MAEIRRESSEVYDEGTRQDEVTTTTDPTTGQVVNVTRRTDQVVNSNGTPANIVETTDPVTGQVVRVNRTTGEVIGQPATRQNVTAQPAGTGLQQQEVQQVTEDPYALRRARTYKFEQAIYLIFGVIEALIAIRFVLRLLAANPNSGFGSFIYGITAPFVAPFEGLFGTPAFNGSVLELTSIVAIVVYALIAWLLVRVVWLLAGESRTGWRSTTERINRRID